MGKVPPQSQRGSGQYPELPRRRPGALYQGGNVPYVNPRNWKRIFTWWAIGSIVVSIGVMLAWSKGVGPFEGPSPMTTQSPTPTVVDSRQ